VDKVAARTDELTRANEALNRQIAEKEVLLKEVHHRVKNNLAVIISLLRMQSSRILDPCAEEALQDCHDRVKAMAVRTKKGSVMAAIAVCRSPPTSRN